MSFPLRSCHPWVWFAVVFLGSATPALAQPPGPLELVRGLREHGHLDLALEYLKDLEGQPISADDKAGIGLERAKCLLAASESEPDEGKRIGMVSEAKGSLQVFLINHPNHPRYLEGLLTDARLKSLDAREQLNRARRMDIPPRSEDRGENAIREAAQETQKKEAKDARPMFLIAAKQFSEASKLLRAKLDDTTLNPATRRNLEREAFEAELAAGINQFNTAETYMPSDLITGAEKEERGKLLEQAKKTFTDLANGPSNNRTVWIAKAWAAEVTFEQDKINDATAEVAAILRSTVSEAAEGKRLIRFFQLRRNFLAAMNEKNLKKVQDSEREIRDWLRTYGTTRKPTLEVYAARYYLARILQSLAENAISRLIDPKDPKKPIDIGETARKQLEAAEKIYRELAQTDHDYTTRATRQRMAVVIRLLGEADKPALSYDSFEKAQMASLIQLSKLNKAEAMPEMTEEEKTKKHTEIQNRQLKTIALLERSRELATPQDNPADVTDVLLRLIYFYQLTDQPYKAAVLGEHVARTIKSTGGKSALAGLFSLNSYLVASRRVRGEDPATVAEARRIDREHAIAMAHFLEEKYPNDNATDGARHQLATMLFEDKKPQEALKTLLKVRPTYSDITSVRLFEGYLVQQLVSPKDSPLAEAEKAEIFRQAVSDLAKVPQPSTVALEKEVRGYISARCRLASLLFAQGRADPTAEKTNPGYDQALAIAEETIGLVPKFDCLVKAEGEMRTLNLNGMEMNLLAQDAYARAAYLRARALIDAAESLPPEQSAKMEAAAKTLESTIDLVNQNGALYTEEMKKWSQTVGGDTEAIQKAKIAQLAVTVDKTRVDVILAGFRLKVRQGKSAEATALLNVMLKAGGTIEDNLPVLELLGREMAAQMTLLRKEKKDKEAKDLGAGLAELLKKITAVPKLQPRMLLFVGQTLQAVGENVQAIDTLKKIPRPEFVGWETKRPEEIPAELRGRVQDQIRDYSQAQLFIARALKESKKFDEAEKMLQAIIGTGDNQGWGYGRLYFRRELASVYEYKGASTTDPKAANAEWGKARNEWAALFNLQKNRLTKKDISPEQRKQYLNYYADAFFDLQRCLVKANEQILKQSPDKLQKTYEEVGKQFAVMEKQIPVADWDLEVQHNYANLLKESPQIVAHYKANGGKLFLEKLPVKP